MLKTLSLSLTIFIILISCLFVVGILIPDPGMGINITEALWA